MTDGDLWQMEAGFWTGDADFYQRHLAHGAMMVFPPPAGVLDRGRIIETISTASRWRDVDMRDRQVARPNPDTVVLAYRASARRDGDASPYRAVCGSVYTRFADGWRLVLHQQSPVTGD
ncbi:MAG: DUF4440 domain-containing protein [Luteimonas sp.]